MQPVQERQGKATLWCRELMDLAHYKCMSQADWLAVKQERLMLDMPLAVEWHKMDSKMLHSFFERHPEAKQGLFQYACISIATFSALPLSCALGALRLGGDT